MLIDMERKKILEYRQNVIDQMDAEKIRLEKLQVSVCSEMKLFEGMAVTVNDWRLIYLDGQLKALKVVLGE